MNNITYSRRLRSFKQKDLAWILEVHPTKISKLEKGVVRPDHQMLDRLSILLQVTPSELYEDFHQNNVTYVMGRLKLFREMNHEETSEKEEENL